MTLDLNITFDDLSEDCKAKIKKLQKLVGKDNFTINYPDINKLVAPSYPSTPNWTKQITTPSSPWPNDRFPEITCTATNTIADSEHVSIKSSDVTLNKQYGVVETSDISATCIGV